MKLNLMHTRNICIDNTFEEIKLKDDTKNPLPPLPALRKSPIEYIVYITKENRTYDEVLGQLKEAKGDATLARFGVGVTVKGKNDSIVSGQCNAQSP